MFTCAYFALILRLTIVKRNQDKKHSECSGGSKHIPLAISYLKPFYVHNTLNMVSFFGE
jgi:hypothetical protein